MEFSEKLKILRIEANMTQNELADKLFISRQAVSNYEQGRSYPSIDILLNMCKLFNTSLDNLLSSGVRKRYMRQVVVAVSLLFVSMLISIVCQYLATFDDTSTVLYTLSEIAIHIIPFMCLVVYMIFQYRPPKRANKFIGYRSKLSMSNQLMWDYAQTYFSMLYAKVSIILVCINMIFSIISVFVDFIALLTMFCVMMCIHAFSLIIPIFFVERKLKILSKK